MIPYHEAMKLAFSKNDLNPFVKIMHLSKLHEWYQQPFTMFPFGLFELPNGLRFENMSKPRTIAEFIDDCERAAIDLVPTIKTREELSFIYPKNRI